MRRYKADYFCVLVAGRTDQSVHYSLDLRGSNNVNIEGSELIISQVVPPETIQVVMGIIMEQSFIKLISFI